MDRLTEHEARAVMLAVAREISAGYPRTNWGDAQDMTLAALCAANQDALLDDLAGEDPAMTPDQARGVLALITAYDALLGTDRAREARQLTPPAVALTRPQIAALARLADAKLESADYSPDGIPAGYTAQEITDLAGASSALTNAAGDACPVPGCTVAPGWAHSPASNVPGGPNYHEDASGRTWIQ